MSLGIRAIFCPTENCLSDRSLKQLLILVKCRHDIYGCLPNDRMSKRTVRVQGARETDTGDRVGGLCLKRRRHYRRVVRTLGWRVRRAEVDAFMAGAGAGAHAIGIII